MKHPASSTSEDDRLETLMRAPRRRHSALVARIFATGLLLAGMVVASRLLLRSPGPTPVAKVLEMPAGPLRRALESTSSFDPLPTPGPSDWLANHPEPGQTFDQFVASQPNRPDATRRTLYLLPLGAFPPEEGPPLEALRRYAAAFFSVETKLLPGLVLTDAPITSRQRSGPLSRQFLTTDILELLKKRLPADAYALMAVTMEDLYPDPSWNFVFGQASLRERVGVFSFARYAPGFTGTAPGQSRAGLLLRRSCKLLVHEAAHIFGVRHCTAWRCLMNGANHLEEFDGAPLHLCPVDLQKLQLSIGFDVLAQHRALLQFYQQYGLEAEARWMAARLTNLEG